MLASKPGSPAAPPQITEKPPRNAKEEPRNAGTFPFVTRWNRRVPTPAAEQGDGDAKAGEDRDQDGSAKHGKHMLEAKDHRPGPAQLLWGIVYALTDVNLSGQWNTSLQLSYIFLLLRAHDTASGLLPPFHSRSRITGCAVTLLPVLSSPAAPAVRHPA